MSDEPAPQGTTGGGGVPEARPNIPLEVDAGGPPLSTAALQSAAPREERLGRREWTRSGLAFAFVLIFGATIIFAFLKVGTRDWVQTKDLLQILLPAETGLLGSALGFYFGAKSTER